MKPETISEARAWDARREAYAESGLSDRAAAAAAWNQPSEEQPSVAESLAVLKMMTKDGDAKIAKDLECYGCGACHKADCFICEYAKARRQAGGFIAKNYKTNNHKNVPELTMKRVTKLARAAASRRQIVCQNCHRPFAARRSDAKWCSPRCRVAGNAA